MSFFNTSNGASNWKNHEKILLRTVFIYFFILVVPLDWKFYREIFSASWSDPSFYDLFKLTTYIPRFFSLSGYFNWLVPLVVAISGAFIWPLADRQQKTDYGKLYYWLRVILRYRLATGIIAFGFIKLFPLQMPYPSLSNLHTNYGDFLPWKIYYHTLGVAQPYEVFLGGVELLAGILLLFRRTTTFGSGIILGFTGNVFVANLAYDAGQEVYSAYLTLIAAVLFAYDAPRLYRLLVLQKYTIANKFRPLTSRNFRKIRLLLKGATAVFLLILGFSTYANYKNGPYKIPKKAGLNGTYGYYNVREFRLNNQVIPYSRTDTNRWQNVVFEKWATISIKTARPIIPDLSNGEGYHQNDIDRNYESAGVGDRRYFAYSADTLQHKLELSNKNKNHKTEHYALQYHFLNDSTIILKGVNERKDSVYALLDRITRKYMLYEGRRKPIKL
ncbi:DoxX family protein [Pedobacter ginsengisoli]|uniref:DoxX family protein n=1 Tax=Pedobacter ginsengisoli TaxID=363852 RepID=UPI002551B546|nr:DoxX family protein [Pedobacter ginsengisoli]